MDHIRAYLLGLLVGGGKVEKDRFIIELPFKKWGEDPKRMGEIARDILTSIQKKFQKTYSIDVDYEIQRSKWIIKPVSVNITKEIVSDLNLLGLPTYGQLIKNADLSIVKTKLTGVFAESFLTGIFDTRASLTKSHRRFVDKAPIVSIEIPGSVTNFFLTKQLCEWLTEMGSVTDQILYNHPNQHSSSNPYYSTWRKGYKIRFLVGSFLSTHSFALYAKSIDAKSIERGQEVHNQPNCQYRKNLRAKPITVHDDILVHKVPVGTENKLFLHYHQICASLGCQFAPYDAVKKLIHNRGAYISFFPLLAKKMDYAELGDNYLTIAKSIGHPIHQKTLTVAELIEFEGYTHLSQGLAFLFSPKLNGVRHKGDMDKILQKNLHESVEMRYINILHKEPLLIYNKNNSRGFICSSINSTTNSDLVKHRTIIVGYDIICK